MTQPIDEAEPLKKLRTKRKDPKRSLAAKKAARNPETQRKRAVAQKKFAKSGAGRQFHKKLGKFNARRSMTKAEGGMKWNALAVQDFLAANPPRQLQAEAEAIYSDIQSGRFGWESIRDRIDMLAERAEGRPLVEVRDHIESDKEEAEKLIKQIESAAKDANKAVQKMMGIDMGFGADHGYSRDVGSTSPNVATFYVKLDRLDVPELKHQGIIEDLISWQNEQALEELSSLTGLKWYQVGRSGGHLLTDLDYAPAEDDVMAREWESEPGESTTTFDATALSELDIKYSQEETGVNDPKHKNDAGSWSAYVDELEALLDGIKEWRAWAEENTKKLEDAEKFIKDYLKGLDQLLLGDIEANEYELANPDEWSKYFKSPLPDSMRSELDAARA